MATIILATGNRVDTMLEQRADGETIRRLIAQLGSTATPPEELADDGEPSSEVR